MPLRVGYACINLTLPATTNRTLRLANLGDVDKVRNLVRQNLDDLERALTWNAAARPAVGPLALFRVGQSLVPFASHPRFPYNWRAEHGPRLEEIGRLARRLGQRLSMHPGQYTNPGAVSDRVVAASLGELRYAADALALLDADGPLVLHLGGAYGDKPAAVRRFVGVLAAAEHAPLRRWLALENDERVWTAAETADAAEALGVPMILDNLHHRLNPGGRTGGRGPTLRAAVQRARATWRAARPGARAKFHLSSQDPARPRGAHAAGIDPADWRELRRALGDAEADVMIEAKEKERAVLALPAE